MFGQNYKNNIIRKYVVTFGALFSTIKVIRDINGTTEQTISVPIQYAPRDPMLARLRTDPNLDKPDSIVLPRMGFEITNIVYDPSRKRGSTVQLPSTNGQYLTFVPVPYDFGFSLFIATKNFSDATTIVEEIIPYFTPEFTVDIELIPNLDRSFSTPIILEGLSYGDDYEGPIEQNRMIIWTLNFRLKGWLFQNVEDMANAGPLIKQILVDLYATANVAQTASNTTAFDGIVIQPGLTANGEPTTNVALSIPYANVNMADDYGIIDFFTGNT